MQTFKDGKVLIVDLSTGETKNEIISADIYRQYPGGSALGMYLLFQEVAPGIDPLSPDNALIFSVSPLTGLPISGQSRMVVTTKSPLTGTAADSQAGGFMPVHIKANGYDSIIFRGKAEKPVYVYIDGDNVEIRDASNVWGKVTGEAEKIILKELNEERVEIAQIGPGGENLVKYACILNMSNRANGRNGVGTVMGSKNLKALVVKKARPMKPENPDMFKNLTMNVRERISKNGTVQELGKHGTSVDLEFFHEEGYIITNNWQKGTFPEGAKNITGEKMSETILIGRETCHACAIRCKRVVEIPGVVDPFYGGPEYETCATFGSYCGNTSLETIALANQLCNMYGLDTISCGATIAFAKECFEKGILNLEDTDGIELTFGNSEAIPKLIKMIALREGLGDLLAEGSMRAAEKLGSKALPLSMCVKGQEMPGHMPQMKPSLALIYAVNPFGADHQSSEHDVFLMLPEDTQERQWLKQIGCTKTYDSYETFDNGKVDFAFASQNFFSLTDTLCLCQFAWGTAWQLYGPEDLLYMCKHGIGWETTLEELMEIGKRRINLMCAFNAREGFTSKNDQLPDRLFKGLPDGPAAGAIFGLNYEWAELEEGIVELIKASMGAIIILLIIGVVIGTWLASGIVPAMIYYGLKILNPAIFLVVTLIMCSIVSLATGSSWTTAATVGIALMGVGQGLGIPVPVIGGCIISGAYFGDKMSPLSDTTNLAPGIAGADLFDHIRHMIYTTGSSYMIGTLGLTPWTYVPYCVLNLVNPLIAAIYGYTGITIEKVDSSKKVSA